MQNPSLNGTAGSASQCSGMAINLSWIPGTGANHPGHTYIASCPGDVVFGSKIDPGFITTVQAFATAQMGVITLSVSFGTATFVIWSRKVALSRPIIDYVVRPILSYFNQRKRPVT